MRLSRSIGSICSHQLSRSVLYGRSSGILIILTIASRAKVSCLRYSEKVREAKGVVVKVRGTVRGLLA